MHLLLLLWRRRGNTLRLAEALAVHLSKTLGILRGECCQSRRTWSW